MTIHIFPNTSRSKANQIMKFNYLADFLKNHTENVMEKLVSDPFLENENETYLWINSLIFYTAYLLYIQVGDYQNILKLRYWSLAFTSFKDFLKNKKRSGTSLPASFSSWFLKKNIFTLYSINLSNFIVWFSFLLDILGNMQIDIVCFPVEHVKNFEINCDFLIKPFSFMTKKVRTKI